MLKDDLVTFGLDEKESLLYLSLLELGEASVLNIARKSGLKRTSVYHLLESLKNRGFIGIVSKKSKQYYFAQNPKKLESELSEKQATLQKMMPELLSLANLIDKKPKIQYFEGVGGMRAILDDELESTDSEIIGWWTEDYLQALGEDYFVNYFNPKRIEKKIAYRSIAPVSEHFKELQKYGVKNLSKIKMMDFGEYNLETDIVMYRKSKIAVISYNEKISLIIDSVKLFNTLKAIFEVQWASIPDQKNNFSSEE